MKKTLTVFLFLLLAIAQVWAVPAYPGLIQFRQPNHDITLSIYLKGDEKVHWAETEDGYTLLHNDKGDLVYAYRDEQGDLMPSDYLATDKDQRSAEVTAMLAKTPQHLTYSKRQVEQMLGIWNDVTKMKSAPKTMTNVIGEKRFLVVLFEFPDCPFTHSRRAFQNMFNQVGYSVDGATGSVHDYYHDVSGGLFSLHVDVVGPYTGQYELAHYGEENGGYQDFAEEAAEYASADVDFSNYDNDHDGHIDGMHIIFAGYGEEAGASSEHIWSHKWNIFSQPVYNDTYVDVYSCSPECSGYYGGNMTAIGVICHELGHVFGAPDYYDTDYAESGGQFPGLGNWDVMSGGSWNRSGRTPAQHNPYTKLYVYKWATCDTLSSPTQVTMRSVTESLADYHRVNTATAGDFFLIENRQQTKWDRNIPGHGMLVYHVHPDANGASVSNYRHPQQIYILAQTSYLDSFPTNNPSSYGDLNAASTPFPGGNYRTAVGDYSCPRMRAWNQALNNKPITNISENSHNGTVSFSFMGTTPYSYNLQAEGVSNEAIRLDWDNYGSYRATIVRSSTGDFSTFEGRHQVGDTLANGDVVIYRDNEGSLLNQELESNTTYWYRLYTNLTDSTYSDTVLTASATTLNCGAQDWTVEDFEQTAAGQLPDCWVSDGDHWTVNVEDGGHVLTSHNRGSHNQCALYSAPFFMADSSSDVVLSFNASFAGAGDATLKVLFRQSIESAWDTLGSVAFNSEWKEYFFTLSPMSYSRLGFVLEGDATAGLHLDNVRLRSGYLLESSATEGGQIFPNGSMVAAMSDTVTFTMHRHSGYRFASLWVNGSNYTSRVDTTRVPTYRMPVNGHKRIEARFERDLAVVDVDKAELNAYPNPTHDMLTLVNIPADVPQIQVYNTKGILMATFEVENDVQRVNLGHLPMGVYLLHVGDQMIRVVRY